MYDYYYYYKTFYNRIKQIDSSLSVFLNLNHFVLVILCFDKIVDWTPLNRLYLYYLVTLASFYTNFAYTFCRNYRVEISGHTSE